MSDHKFWFDVEALRVHEVELAYVDPENEDVAYVYDVKLSPDHKYAVKKAWLSPSCNDAMVLRRSDIEKELRNKTRERDGIQKWVDNALLILWIIPSIEADRRAGY